MERIDLKVQLRKETGKGAARQYRQKGLIPAILYGAKIEPTPLMITEGEFKRALKGKTGENLLVNLIFEGEGVPDTQVAMVRDFQIDVVKRNVIHIDFQQIDLGKKITVAVPIELIGKPEGVKLGGILQQVERELEIRCMPLNIPDTIKVDVSQLMIGESLHVKDILAPEGVEVISPGEQTVVTILAPTKAEEVAVEEEKIEEKEEKPKKSET